MLGLLHTADVHEATFDALVAELDPTAEVRAVVDEEVLTVARERGPESVGPRVAVRLQELADAGARRIVCTCSTIGGVAEEIGGELGLDVVRVDRPMAELAVAIGGRIVVVAAVESTLGPTRELLESVAEDRGAEVSVEIHLIGGAWERFAAGDTEGYQVAIAAAIPDLARDADVVVLAQASMAPAATLVDVAVPVLSSPRLAVAAALGSAAVPSDVDEQVDAKAGRPSTGNGGGSGRA